MNKSDNKSLSRTVIDNGYCIGCGICSYINPIKYDIVLNKYGMYQAKVLNDAVKSKGEEIICPFSNDSKNEDMIANNKFKKLGLNYAAEIGYYWSVCTGYLNDQETRIESTSGGLTTWILTKLLKDKKITGVIHVGEVINKIPNIYFNYKISRTVEEIEGNRKSRYYPVHLADIIKVISGSNEKLAVVGIPCFIKALQNLKEEQPERFDCIKYFIGIVCGHLKSTKFINMFAMQNKVPINKIKAVDFRVKIKDKDAGEYGLSFTFEEGQTKKNRITKPAKDHYGADWGMSYLKYKACDYCEDVCNETADISFGDAWIKPFRNEWMGTNLVVFRNIELMNIFDSGVVAKEISLVKISIEEAIQSQEPSIRHRKKYISIRLMDQLNKGIWIPRKKALPTYQGFEKKIIKIQRLRMLFVEKSHKMFYISQNLHSWFTFKILMMPLYSRYMYTYYGVRGIIPNKIKQIIKKILYIQ